MFNQPQAIKRAAYRALCDADLFDEIKQSLQATDEELLALREMLEAEIDPPHASDCARRLHGAAECTCAAQHAARYQVAP